MCVTDLMQCSCCTCQQVQVATLVSMICMFMNTIKALVSISSNTSEYTNAYYIAATFVSMRQGPVHFDI